MTQPFVVYDSVVKRFGDVTAVERLDLEIGKGEFLAIMGSSGCGKTTMLRMLAGLEAPSQGEIRLNGARIDDLPTWGRDTPMVWQSLALFPFLTVRENVEFGLRMRGVGRAERRRRADDWLERMQLSEFAERNVARLSGGQRQRVALARCLVTEPEILLLDEPLSALDEKIRREMQDELRGIQQSTGTTFVYVTHDQEEALTMSDRVAVLNRGRCVQCDAPERLFRRPRTRFVAAFFRGCNILEVTAEPRDGAMLIDVSGERLSLPAPLADASGPRAVAVRGEAVRLGGGGDLVLPTRLEKITYRGVYSDYRLRLSDGQRLSAMQPHRHDLAEGDQVEIGLRAEDVVLLEDD